MIRDSAVLYLSWLAVVCGAMFLILAEMLPLNPPFLNADTLFVALAETEMFFILILWPFFILRSHDHGMRVEASRVALETLMLFILALPLMLIGQSISAVPMATFLKTLAALMACAAAVSTLFYYGTLRGIAVAPWYYFTIFFLSAGLPFFAYLTMKEPVIAPATLASFSPFWGLSVTGQETGSSVWMVLAIAATGVAIAMIMLAWLFARRSARTGPYPPAGA